MSHYPLNCKTEETEQIPNISIMIRFYIENWGGEGGQLLQTN